MRALLLLNLQLCFDYSSSMVQPSSLLNMNIEYQYSPLGVILNIKNIRSNCSTLVLWRQKTWNNDKSVAMYLVILVNVKGRILFSVKLNAVAALSR